MTPPHRNTPSPDAGQTQAADEAETVRLIQGLAAGANEAQIADLFRQLQWDLRRIARRERFTLHAGATMSTTAPINETYLKLQQSALEHVGDEGHFVATVTRAMRFVLTDYARARYSQKRGGDLQFESLDEQLHAGDTIDAGWQLELSDALDKLAQLSPRLADVVQLRYYGGFQDKEIGELLDIDESTVRRDWLKARGWLFQELKATGT